MAQRILICGDRNWTNKALIRVIVHKIISNEPIEVIIDGCAAGADSLGHEIAEELDIPSVRFPANWKLYHKAAGHIRNQQMLTEGKPTLILAFHNDILHSKGTKDMIARSKRAGIQTIVFTETD